MQTQIQRLRISIMADVGRAIDAVKLIGAQQSTGGGATYVRWGRTTCSGSGVETLYTGKAAKAFYSHRGGGHDYQCFPEDPEYGDYRERVQGYSYVYGVEYEYPIPRLGGSTDLHDHDVPCAVCHVPTRSSLAMIPVKLTCPTGWTEEYNGYLMTERRTHHSSTFECVDIDAEAGEGGVANRNGGLFYHVEAVCTYGLQCPPYVAEKEVTCIVCTK